MSSHYSEFDEVASGNYGGRGEYRSTLAQHTNHFKRRKGSTGPSIFIASIYSACKTPPSYVHYVHITA